MNEPLIQKPDNKASDKFRQMADAIDHNAAASFGGAVVIVPPSGQQGGGGGEPIELLMLDASGSAAQFWSTVKTRIEMALAELQEKERNIQGFGRR